MKPRPRLSRWRALLVAGVLGGCLVAASPAQTANGNGGADEVAPPAAAVESGWVHAYAAYSTPKYPSGFAHFDYVDPQAPKGGTLVLGNPDRRTSFDKFNPYTVRGNAPAALGLFMFESLATASADEPQTMYGLLAESMKIEPDFSAVTFRLNPKARFYNGDPVTADDVVHSYQIITGPKVSPAYPAIFSALGRITKLDDRTVRFDLRDRSIDTVFVAGGVPVFSRKWGLGEDGKRKPFDEIVTEYPITSGPYTIARADSGRRLELKRNPDYWARDLNVRRGHYNFERIVYRYYRDRAVQMEAFKAGEFDLIQEYSARRWDRAHKGPKWDDGRIQKRRFESDFGQGGQAYRLNLRRPIFQDLRVREAIDLSYDFENVNRLGQYQRMYSLFNNTEFAAQGLPSPAELKLLEPYRAELPAAVFGPAYRPPRTDTGPHALRRNLLRARDLLAQAGWKTDADGVLRNAKGEPFVFEYLSPEEGAARNVAGWIKNLQKLGITMRIRVVDFALYTKRLDVFDFDMVAIVSGEFALPSAAEFQAAWTTQAAEPEGANLSGLTLKALDALIAQMAAVRTLDELRTVSRAIDRIVMHSRPFVPELYSASHRVSWWNKFGMSPNVPGYMGVDTGRGNLPWPIATWWLKDLRPAR
jgi:peptide/nickel transport system substrate-binding protein/microcin C transport system substrate-binding protein